DVFSRRARLRHRIAIPASHAVVLSQAATTAENAQRYCTLQAFKNVWTTFFSDGESGEGTTPGFRIMVAQPRSGLSAGLFPTSFVQAVMAHSAPASQLAAASLTAAGPGVYQGR